MNWWLESYELLGPAHVVRFGADGVTIFVVRYAGRGAGWMRYVRRIGRDGWHVTWYRTKAQACKPA